MCLPLGGPKCWNDLVNWTWRFSSVNSSYSSCSCRPECQWCIFHHRLVIYIKCQSDTPKSVCRTASDTFPHYHQTCGADMNYWRWGRTSLGWMVEAVSWQQKQKQQDTCQSALSCHSAEETALRDTASLSSQHMSNLAAFGFWLYHQNIERTHSLW